MVTDILLPPAWTYSFYRATLYYKGKHFAIVTAVDLNGLDLRSAELLMEQLNGRACTPDMLIGDPHPSKR